MKVFVQHKQPDNIPLQLQPGESSNLRYLFVQSEEAEIPLFWIVAL